MPLDHNSDVYRRLLQNQDAPKQEHILKVSYRAGSSHKIQVLDHRSKHNCHLTHLNVLDRKLQRGSQKKRQTLHHSVFRIIDFLDRVHDYMGFHFNKTLHGHHQFGETASKKTVIYHTWLHAICISDSLRSCPSSGEHTLPDRRPKS